MYVSNLFCLCPYSILLHFIYWSLLLGGGGDVTQYPVPPSCEVPVHALQYNPKFTDSPSQYLAANPTQYIVSSKPENTLQYTTRAPMLAQCSSNPLQFAPGQFPANPQYTDHNNQQYASNIPLYTTGYSIISPEGTILHSREDPIKVQHYIVWG